MIDRSRLKKGKKYSLRNILRTLIIYKSITTEYDADVSTDL